MEARIIKDDKSELTFELDNQTVAELLRMELNKDDDVELAAWKREHPEKPVIFEIKTSGKSAKKVLQDAIASLEKQLDKIQDEFKKALK